LIQRHPPYITLSLNSERDFLSAQKLLCYQNLGNDHFTGSKKSDRRPFAMRNQQNKDVKKTKA
jgi:hypothetical protein